MALIKCTECNQEISTEATVCPHCGNPNLPVVIEQGRGRKDTVKAIVGFSIVGIMFIWLYFFSGNPMALLLSHTPLKNPFSPTAQAPSGHAIPIQEVKNLGYDFFVGQIDSADTVDITDDIKNQITKIAYDAHFPINILKNIPIIILNNLALTGDQYIPTPKGKLNVPDLKPDFLSEGGFYSTYEGGLSVIYINKPIIAQGQFVEVLTHELGHAIGDMLTDQEWKTFYQLRVIPVGTDRHGTNWNLSPGEDFAEVYKNVFTNIDIRTYYGQLIPRIGDVEFGSCVMVYLNTKNSYAPHVDSSDPSAWLDAMRNPPKIDYVAVSAKANADPKVQACRRDVMSNQSKYQSDWLYGIPYKSTVSQTTRSFITDIANRLNK